jgi:aminoglycoside phosphotransferase (APT) family kinase protein
MPEWSAEVWVDEPLVRRLLAQFPALEPGSVELLGEGWDNSVWLVDGRWIFRFPRREVAVPAVRRQVELLPSLAPLLPLAVPEPAFAGHPADGFPWPFFGCAFIRGRELPDARLDEAARVRLARPLGEFLQALHDPARTKEVPGADRLPIDPMGRGDMAIRVPRTEGRLAELESRGLWRRPGEVDRVLAEARELPAPSGETIAHGDLHFRHLLVDDEGAPTAVVDWDDLCRAEPSVDLPLVWSHLPPDARADFARAYGPLGDDQLLRARVLALFLCAALALYASHEWLPTIEREALAGLDRAAAG